MCVLNYCLSCDRCCISKCRDKFFINKPDFLNFVPQLIRNIYRVGTTWFYRFACTMVAQAHTSLMTRLIRTQKKHKNNLHYEKKTDAFAFFSRLIFKRDSIRLIMTVTRSFYNFRKLIPFSIMVFKCSTSNSSRGIWFFIFLDSWFWISAMSDYGLSYMVSSSYSFSPKTIEYKSFFMPN